ncbi:type IV secretion system ATPase VirD4 [Ensifer sp. YR511]|uniref:type IV secretion system ATPase VirD4 n=1 Tax=Ensifer sp. YR511 TaxID=1855294 RepID=UPI0008900390|nr:type IV secretion system ATPase VirD4 [Ensifer sp. YR511]SDO11464.1 type IV secretion system protein VirD4 [Ensifer sp. YR511]
MIQDGRQKLNTLLFGIAFSLPVGLVFSSLYITLKHDRSASALAEFDIFAVWYETPFYLGFVTADFYTCLSIVGGTALLMALILSIVLFKMKHFGTARWGRFQEMRQQGYIKPYRKVAGPIFGKTSGPRGFGQYLTNGEQPHSLIVAPTRAGKGVGIVIPTLLTFNGSVLALDVKGELFELTSRARKAKGDRIFKFAPLDKDRRTSCYNPVLDIVAMPPERRFTEARRMAHNLIAAKGKGAEGFIDGARDLFVAGVLACIERGNPTIGAVYDLFAAPGEKYKLFAQLAEESKIPEVTRIFDNMAGNDTKIITSYTSVLGDGGLNLWADPMVKSATSRSDFSIYELRRDPTSVYLCVSPNDLEVIAPLVRLFFQQVVSILQREMPKKDEIFEVLFLLDEFKHLGQLDAIETAVTTIAGYKGRFMFIIQSLSALTGAYEQAGKENFLSNTGVQVFMATADDETPEYISKAIGEYTFRNKTKSYSQKELWDTNIQESNQGALLMRPEQVRLLDDDKQIVLIKGQPPLHMHKVKYYADRKLKRLFEGQKGELPEPDPIPLMTEPSEIAMWNPEPAHESPTAPLSPQSAPNDVEMDVETADNSDEDYAYDAGFEDEDRGAPRPASVIGSFRTQMGWEETERLRQVAEFDRKLRTQAAHVDEKSLATDDLDPDENPNDSALVAQRELLQRIKDVQARNRVIRELVE